MEICGENEPVLVSGMEFCKAARKKLGLATVVTTNKAYDKGRTGIAERCIQTVRRLANTLLNHLETEIEARSSTIDSMFMGP